MMIDMEFVDKLFEACPQMQFSIFDRRVLLPLTQLPEAVARETGEAISQEELRIRAGQGWFPLLPGAGEDGTEEGSPLYVPSRIGLFLNLQRQGYTTDELRPVFPSLGKLHNARTGMFEESEFRRVLAEVSDDRKPFVEAAYWSGWRKRELLNLRWSQIDFMRGEMKLGREHSKNGQPRVFPFSELPPLRDVLYRQRQRTDEIEKKIGRKVEYVFHRRGNVIKEYYGAWRSACKRAGVSGRLVHDFRRTAVDRLEWSGVPRAVAMKLTGHETDAVYPRYHIARGKDLRAGVARVAEYIEALNRN